MDITRIRKPRCYLLHALAPQEVSPGEANQILNRICADHGLPLAVYHDHFIGQAGGIIMFYAETSGEREALQNNLEAYLAGWEYTLHPLIFSYSPAAFDAQIAFTLRAYRQLNWERLRKDERPAAGNPGQEAESAQES